MNSAGTQGDPHDTCIPSPCRGALREGIGRREVIGRREGKGGDRGEGYRGREREGRERRGEEGGRGRRDDESLSEVISKYITGIIMQHKSKYLDE